MECAGSTADGQLIGWPIRLKTLKGQLKSTSHGDVSLVQNYVTLVAALRAPRREQPLSRESQQKSQMGKETERQIYDAPNACPRR